MMAEAGYLLLADVVLWLTYVVIGVAVAVAAFSAVRSIWMERSTR